MYERSRILEDTLASAVRDGACPVLPTRGQKPAGGSFAFVNTRTPYTLPKECSEVPVLILTAHLPDPVSSAPAPLTTPSVPGSAGAQLDV